jgi:hypothetical protein
MGVSGQRHVTAINYVLVLKNETLPGNPKYCEKSINNVIDRMFLKFS